MKVTVSLTLTLTLTLTVAKTSMKDVRLYPNPNPHPNPNRGEDEHEADEEEGDRQARGPVSETSPVWPANAAQPSLRAARGTIWRRQRRPPGEERPAWFSAYFHPGEASTA